MTKNEYLISEFVLDKIESNLDEAIKELRQAIEAGKIAGKLTIFQKNIRKIRAEMELVDKEDV
ncbi:MAG TPA: hypothetical protein EYO96_03600 [Candidatus Marinimicrobia bacterium]|nr:hypothetical protein [Candidatus Neomarinimicrobiota bacterium]